jgi:hypothetical protein
MSDKSCISESAFQGDRLERQVEPQSGKSGQKASSLSVVFFFWRSQPPGLAQQDQVPVICKLKTKNESSGRSEKCVAAGRGLRGGGSLFRHGLPVLAFSNDFCPLFLLSLLLLGRRNVAQKGRSSKSECNRRLIAFSLPAQQRSSSEEVRGGAGKRRDLRTEFVSHWEVPNRMVALTDSDIQHVRKGRPQRRNKNFFQMQPSKLSGRLSEKSTATRDISMRRLQSRQLLGRMLRLSPGCSSIE